MPVMKEGDEDGQADGGFGGGDGHHEKDEKESVDLMELAGVGDEGEVHRVHHQLDAHEDGDAVAPRQHAADADGEEDGAEDQEPVRRDHVVSSFFATPVRPLSKSAPTMAASSRIDTISNGKMYASNMRMPTVRASETNGPSGSFVTPYLPR